MKAKIRLLLLVFCCPVFSIAQNVGPGTVASGLSTQGSASSVDYTTGQMQYRIPLFHPSGDLSAPRIQKITFADIGGSGQSIDYGTLVTLLRKSTEC